MTARQGTRAFVGMAAPLGVLLVGLGLAIAPDEIPEATAEAPLEVLFEQASQRRLAGAYEEAAALYVEVLRQPQASAERAALAAAEAFLAARQYGAALDMADRGLQSNPASSEGHLLRARALADLGRSQDALRALAAHVEHGPIGGYGAFAGGELLDDQGDSREAREWYVWAVDLGLAKLWEVSALKRIGDSLWAEGQPAAAAIWLERAAARAMDLEARGQPVWFDGELVRRSGEARRPALLQSAASAHRAALDLDSAAAFYREIATVYPSAKEAEVALDALAEMGRYYTVAPYDRGRVLLQAGRADEAGLAFTRALRSEAPAPSASAARYYRAAAARDAGNPGEAIDEWVAFAREEPGSPLAPEALWQAARVTERSIGTWEAISSYLFLAQTFPSSQRAGQALLRAGWLELQMGEADAARATWARLGREHPDAGARAQGLFWLGRGQLGLGDVGAAVSILDEAAQAAPRVYEGVRARDLREGGLGAEPYGRMWTPRLPPGDLDTAECHAWLQEWSPQGEAAAADRLDRVDRLLAVGLLGPAQVEALEAAPRSSPWELYELSVALHQWGLYPVSIYLASLVAGASPEGSTDQAPGCLRRLIYPLAYSDLVQQEATRYGLDPFLLLALLRQESWFGSRARSPAEALGLSQVIPSTAREIAQALGRQGFAHDDLLRPKESIAFGAWYLAQQYRNLGQRPVLALAAYNGGPGSAMRWTGGDLRVDPDDFVERIDFPETRTYVRTIYETYARYREVYG